MSTTSADAGLLVINEVYYDHPGADDGWEFVEIFNPCAYPVSLDGCRLEAIDGATGARRLLWQGAAGSEIPAAGLVTVGGDLRPEVRQGFTLYGRIENGPDCVVLVEGGYDSDLVGYGVLDDPGLFEGDPAPDVASGSSLSRNPDGNDTGDNSSDFVEAEPTPSMLNFPPVDIAIEPLGKASIFCRGGYAGVLFVLVNRGTEDLAGQVSITGSCAGLGECARDIFPVSLDAGGSARLRIGAGPGLPERCIVCLRAAFEGDMRDFNDTASVALSGSPGDLVINELMPRPSESGCEWIELYNRSGSVVDPSGWVMSDARGNSASIPGGFTQIGPEGFLILAEDEAAFESAHPVCTARVAVPEGSWPSLNDRDGDEYADMITLVDGEGFIVDRISYTDMYGLERGRSLERSMPSACSDSEEGLWLRSASESGASPGEVNSVLPGSLEGAGSVSLSSRVIHPVPGEPLVVSGTRLPGETGMRVSVFDVSGLLIRTVYACAGGAESFGCRWNGKRDDGRTAGAGLYVIVVEFTGKGGEVCRRVKECVALTGD